MDAAYIRETVHMPLMEGLLAAVISNPIDKVDFLGNYLINYIQKKNDDILKQKEINNAEELAKLEKIYELNEIREIELKKQADEMKLQKFHSYLTYDLMKFSNKQEIMNSICTFASEHLLIPACYIAERKINDDKDILEYIAANPSQSAIVLGKSIQNSSTDVEVAERSGISFEAFKMKEIDLEAITNDEDIDGEEEVEDGDEEKMPKKAFKPRPLIVDNVMRDKRVKFFGASKLGSFFAIPLELQSSAYEGGCVKAETQEVEDEEEQKEEGEETNDAEDSESFKNEMDKTESRPVYKAVTEKREFLFAADTIGQFHQFQAHEIEALETIGTAMIDAFSRLEKESFSRHVVYLTSTDAHTDAITTACATAVEEEEKVTLEVETLTAANEPSNEPEAVTTANEEGQENEEDDNEKEAKNTEKKELQIQRDIAIAVQGVWTRVLLSEDVFTHVLALGKYELPPPVVVMDLLTQLARHLALDPILYSDQHNKPSWSIISHNILPELKTAIERHVISLTSGDQDVITASGNTNEAIKATCEENGLFDITTYSSLIPSAGVCALLGVLTSWLQKSLEAQERVVAYLKYGSDDNEQIVTE